MSNILIGLLTGGKSNKILEAFASNMARKKMKNQVVNVRNYMRSHYPDTKIDEISDDVMAEMLCKGAEYFYKSF